MSDHLDRAAKAMWEATCPDGLRAAIRPDCWEMAKALDAAGLLASPERDAKVAAKALRDAADALEGGVTAHDLEAITFGRRSAVAALRDRADRIEREAGESDADA